MPVVGIAEWVHDNMPRISLAAQLSGGWEVWAHVEIALKMRQKYPELDRERNIFHLNTKEYLRYMDPSRPNDPPSEPRNHRHRTLSRCGSSRKWEVLFTRVL